jgi:hypothetical protein
VTIRRFHDCRKVRAHANSSPDDVVELSQGFVASRGMTDPQFEGRHVGATPKYEIAAARPKDLALLPVIELAAARLLSGHAPELPTQSAVGPWR